MEGRNSITPSFLGEKMPIKVKSKNFALVIEGVIPVEQAVDILLREGAYQLLDGSRKDKTTESLDQVRFVKKLLAKAEELLTDLFTIKQ